MSAPPVVLGAGLAGLAAAAALRRTHPAVVVVERDQLPAMPISRRGVPQGGQLHNLLTRAQHHLDELLPGFTDRLLAAGGRAAVVGTQTHVYELGITMPPRDLGLRLLCAPRPLVDHVARELLMDGGGVTFRTTERAGDLLLAGDRIGGVWVDGPGGRSLLETSIVVDATGPGTSIPRWLTTAGRQTPERVVAHPRQWYVTLVLRRPPALEGDPRFWLVFPWDGDGRGALLSPVGHDRWYLSVSGSDGDPIPHNIEDVVAHAGGLSDPTIGALVAKAVPEGPLSTFRKLTATWFRYDQISHPVGGLFPIGDALASLNPLFGQGMSVAAWEAATLADVLGDAYHAGIDPSNAAVARVYHRLAAAAVATAWDLDAVVDRASSRLAGGTQALVRLIQSDPETHRRYVGIWHLIEPATWLEGLSTVTRFREATAP